MILEHAILSVKPGRLSDFEQAMATANPLIACQPGFISLELRRSAEGLNQYLLLIHWASIEAHRDGFRNSPQYQKWRGLLHHFYDPMPSVTYFEAPL